MHVCWEAFEVARRHGYVDKTWSLPTWLQPSLDSVLFYHSEIEQQLWYSELTRDYEHDRSRARHLAAVFDWASRIDMPLAFYHLDLYPFLFETAMEMNGWQRNYIAPQIAFLNEFANLGRHSAFPCAIETVVLHITREQAAHSGLFGWLGEDLCQLVDVNDSERIRQFYRLWRPTCPNKRRRKAAMSMEWDSLLAKDELRRAVDDWQAKLQYVLLGAVWKTTTTAVQQMDASLEGVFSSEIDALYFPEFDCHQLVETHPWVIATREWLPTLLPCISKGLLKATLY